MIGRDPQSIRCRRLREASFLQTQLGEEFEEETCCLSSPYYVTPLPLNPLPARATSLSLFHKLELVIRRTPPSSAIVFGCTCDRTPQLPPRREVRASLEPEENQEKKLTPHTLPVQLTYSTGTLADSNQLINRSIWTQTLTE